MWLLSLAEHVLEHVLECLKSVGGVQECCYFEV